MKMYSGSFMILSYLSLVWTLQMALVLTLLFRLELTGAFYVCETYFSPNRHVIFTDMFQHFGVRWMNILLLAQQYFLDNTHVCLKST